MTRDELITHARKQMADLVHQLPMGVYNTMDILVDFVERDGKALASPSEGNKKGGDPNRPVPETHGGPQHTTAPGSYEGRALRPQEIIAQLEAWITQIAVLDEFDEDDVPGLVAIIRDAIGALSESREQPRKATGKDIEALFYEAIQRAPPNDFAPPELSEVGEELVKLFAERGLSVSPAAAEEWQPIETAPKDGTRIWLGDAKNVVTGYWSPPVGAWRTDWLVGQPGDKPTHWMPFVEGAPAPPSAPEQEKGEQT